MTFPLEIRPNGIRARWWHNFTSTVRVEKFGPGFGFTTAEWVDYRDALLRKHNAAYDGKYVHFDAEQDAVFFLLRWS